MTKSSQDTLRLPPHRAQAYHIADARALCDATLGKIGQGATHASRRACGHVDGLHGASAAVDRSSDLMDEKTGKWTDRGLVASAIAAAQVSEMRCGLKRQISAALRTADKTNMHFDLNDKVDFSDVIFPASNLMESVKKSAPAGMRGARNIGRAFRSF
jgi:hypothetical protein